MRRLAEYKITIQNRIAMAEPGIFLICNNPTDTIRFEFDDEWSGDDVKTARFSWQGKYIDVPFNGNIVQVPEIFQTNHVYIGVFTETITSAPAKVNCRYSIKCHGGNPAAPAQNVYQEIIKLINHGITNANIDENGHLILSLTDGTEYDCGYAKGSEGVGIESFFQTGLGIGSGGENTIEVTLTDGRKETFSYYNGRDGFSPSIVADETEEEIILTITNVNGPYTVSIPKIPQSIEVPDDLAPGGGGLPAVNSDDNGKVLTVVDGAWAANDTPDLHIGGRNLARNTIAKVSGIADAANGGTAGYTLSDTYWRGLDVRIDSRKEYTLSFDYEFDWTGCASEMPTSVAGISVNIFSGTGSDFVTNIISRDADYATYGEGYSKGKFVITFAGSTDAVNPCFAFRPLRSYGPDITGLKLTISNFMLEEGNKPSAWVPAIEDVYEKIEAYHPIQPNRNYIVGTDTPFVAANDGTANKTLHAFRCADADVANSLYGKTVTISFDYESNITSGMASMVYDKTWQVVYRFNPGDTSGRVVITTDLKIPTEPAEFNKFAYLQGDWVGDIVISNMKLEIGDTATEWVLALEDEPRTYELIDSVTIMEDVNEIIMDGFDLKSLVLEMTLYPGASACNGWVQIRESRSVTNLQCDIPNLRMADANNPRYCRLMAEKLDNVARIFAVKPMVNTNGASTPVTTGVFVNPGRFGCLRIYLSNGELFTAGSKFELWGVRT